MTARLRVTHDAYVLEMSPAVPDGPWRELAALRAGGAQALLPAARPMGAAALEEAIQRVEDWLMPHARTLHGEALEVRDEAGRFVPGLVEVLAATERAWTVEALERRFLEMIDLATGRVVPASLQAHRGFVADLVLLRELAHHGQVAGIRLV